jgi:hypothetical protein
MVVLIALALASCGARTALEIREAAPADGSVTTSRMDARVQRDAATTDAGVDARELPDSPEPLDAATVADAFVDPGDPCEIGPDPLREPVCTRPLFGEPPTLSCPGGFVDVAAQGDGVLAWECGGTRAEARFGARVYRGPRIGDVVSLCIRTEFDYTDGCHWQTSQRIEGDATGASLALTYREVAISGDGDCFPPCTADSVVELR